MFGGVPVEAFNWLFVLDIRLDYVSKDPFVSFSDFAYDNIVISKEEIFQVNPHRFEMMLLDGILLVNDDFAVGFKDLTDDEFWIRGHFPHRPLMPGVLMCECAAQLSSYFAVVKGIVTDRMVGLGGLEEVRFRGPVIPGDRLTVMLKKGKVRKNVIFKAAFQGYVDETLVVDGVIKGVAI